MSVDDLRPPNDPQHQALLLAESSTGKGVPVKVLGPLRPLGFDRLILQEGSLSRSGPTEPEAPRDWLDAGHPRRLGRFEILRTLGQGGFGIVYLARDPVLGREVAIKLPRPGVLVTPEIRRRFLYEARAAAQLDHPNIVPVHEASELGSTCYITSTYCSGPTLSRWLKGRATPVPADLAARLVAELADAVQHAHDHEILHRDIKPSNVILTGCHCAGGCGKGTDDIPTREAATPSAQVVPGDLAETPIGCDPCGLAPLLVPRLTDFGLARSVEDFGDESRSGVPVGSPPYMAPEQAAGRIRETAPPTDVYALGATLYEILTGRPPFRGETPTETIRMVLDEEPVSPRTLRPSLPRDLETICLKCLAKGQGQRYATAAALRDDLRRFLEGLPILARPLSIWQRTARLVRRRPAHAAVAVLTLVLLVGSLSALCYWASLRESYTRLLEQQVARADANAHLAERHLHAFQLRQARQRLEAGQVERAQDILREIAPTGGPGGGIRRQFAWEYLWNRSRRSLHALSRRSEQVSSIALSADGQSLATGDVDGTVRLRDPRTGDLRATLRGHNARVYRLSFAPDGGRLASAAWCDREGVRDEVLVWDLKQLRIQNRFEGFGGESIGLLRFAPDGQRLWSNGKPEDGRPTHCLWDLPEDTAIPSLLWKGSAAAGWPVNHDGTRTIADGPGETLELWNLAARRRIVTTRLGPHTWVALSRSGRRMAYQPVESRKVLMLDLNRGGRATPVELGEVRGELLHVEFSPDDRRLLWSDHQGEIVVWDLASGRSRRLTPDRVEEATPYATFSASGRRLAYTYNGRLSGPHPVKIMELEGLSDVETYPGELDLVTDLVFSPEGAALLVSTTEGLTRWDLSPPPEPAQPAGHTDEAWAAVFSPDGSVFASGSDDTDDRWTIRLWDVADGALLRGWNAGVGTVSALAYDAGGKLLVSTHLAPTDNVRLWDPTTGRQLGTLAGHTDRVRAMALHSGGRLLATGGSDRTIRLWDLNTRTCRKLLKGHSEAITSVAFSPDGQWLASAGNDGTVRVWSLGSEEVIILHWVEKLVGVAFLPGGSRVVAADEDGRISFWDLATRTCVRTIDTEDPELRCLDVRPDAELVVAAGKGHTIRLWDISTGQELLSLEGHQAQINRVAFSPDGLTLASCSHDGVVRLWRSRPQCPPFSPETSRPPSELVRAP